MTVVGATAWPGREPVYPSHRGRAECILVAKAGTHLDLLTAGSLAESQNDSPRAGIKSQEVAKLTPEAAGPRARRAGRSHGKLEGGHAKQKSRCSCFKKHVQKLRI